MKNLFKTLKILFIVINFSYVQCSYAWSFNRVLTGIGTYFGIIDEEEEVQSEPSAPTTSLRPMARPTSAFGNSGVNRTTPIATWCTAPQSRGLGFEMPGISDLMDHLDQSACHPIGILQASSEEGNEENNIRGENGEIDSVKFCEMVDERSAEAQCAQNFSASDVGPLTSEILENSETAQAFDDAVKANLQKDLSDLHSISKFQSEVLRDEDILTGIRDRLSGLAQSNPALKNYYKNRLGIDLDNQNMTITEFGNTLFQCAAGSQAMQAFNPTEACGATERNQRVARASESIYSDCLQGNGSCPLVSHDLQGNNNGSAILSQFGRTNGFFPNFGELLGNVREASQQAQAESAVCSEDTQAVGGGQINEELRDAIAENATGLFYQRDGQGPRIPFSDRIIAVAAAVSRDRLSPLSQHARELAARREARNMILDSRLRAEITGEYGFSYEDLKAFMDDHLLNDEGVIDSGRISNYGDLTERFSSFMASRRPASEAPPAINMSAFEGIINTAVHYENYGASLVRSSFSLGALIDSGPEFIENFDNAYRGFRQSGRGIAASQSALRYLSSLESSFRGQCGSENSVWVAAAQFESIFSDEVENALNGAFLGARSIMSEIHRMNEQFDQVNGDTPVQAGSREFFIRNNALTTIALRSALSCADKMRPAYQEQRYCSPLGSPDVSNAAIVDLLQNPESVNDEKLLGKVRLLCSSILNDDFERRADAQNVHHFDSNLWASRMQRCQERSASLFCQSADCSDVRNNTGREFMAQSQQEIYGYACTEGQQDESNTPAGVAITAQGDFDVLAETGAGETTNPEFLTSTNNTSWFRPGTGLVENVTETQNRVNLGDPTRIFSNTSRANNDFASPSGNSNLGTSGSGGSISNGSISTPVTTPVVNTSPASVTSVINGPTPGSQGQLSGQLGTVRSELNPETRSLLDRLTDMEKRYMDLQDELRRSREGSEEMSESERAALMSEISELRRMIPEVESQIAQREDVRQAAPEAIAAVNPAPAQQFNANPQGRITSSAARGPASVAPTAAPVVAPPVSSLGGGSLGGGSSAPRAGRSGGDGDDTSSSGEVLVSSLASGAPIRLTSSSVLLLSQAKENAVIVEGGVSAEQAILDNRSAVLVPTGEEGEFILYEPELGPDGEVLFENGEIKYASIRRVLEDGRSNGRVPASIVEEVSPLAPGYDPRRLYELEAVLEDVQVNPAD